MTDASVSKKSASFEAEKRKFQQLLKADRPGFTSLASLTPQEGWAAWREACEKGTASSELVTYCKDSSGSIRKLRIPIKRDGNKVVLDFSQLPQDLQVRSLFQGDFRFPQFRALEKEYVLGSLIDRSQQVNREPSYGVRSAQGFPIADAVHYSPMEASGTDTLKVLVIDTSGCTVQVSIRLSSTDEKIPAVCELFSGDSKNDEIVYIQELMFLSDENNDGIFEGEVKLDLRSIIDLDDQNLEGFRAMLRVRPIDPDTDTHLFRDTTQSDRTNACYPRDDQNAPLLTTTDLFEASEEPVSVGVIPPERRGGRVTFEIELTNDNSERTSKQLIASLESRKNTSKTNQKREAATEVPQADPFEVKFSTLDEAIVGFFQAAQDSNEESTALFKMNEFASQYFRSWNNPAAVQEAVADVAARLRTREYKISKVPAYFMKCLSNKLRQFHRDNNKQRTSPAAAEKTFYQLRSRGLSTSSAVPHVISSSRSENLDHDVLPLLSPYHRRLLEFAGQGMNGPKILESLGKPQCTGDTCQQLQKGQLRCKEKNGCQNYKKIQEDLRKAERFYVIAAAITEVEKRDNPGGKRKPKQHRDATCLKSLRAIVAFEDLLLKKKNSEIETAYGINAGERERYIAEVTILACVPMCYQITKIKRKAVKKKKTVHAPDDSGELIETTGKVETYTVNKPYFTDDQRDALRRLIFDSHVQPKLDDEDWKEIENQLVKVAKRLELGKRITNAMLDLLPRRTAK